MKSNRRRSGQASVEELSVVTAPQVDVVRASATAAVAARSTPRGGIALTVARQLGPALLYLLLALVMTYPLVRVFGDALPGDGRDGLQNYWNFWWTARALGSGQNPFVTPLLYAPQGAPLYLHTLNLFNGLLSLPIQSLFGVVAAYNTVVLLSFTLSGYFTYWLVLVVTRSRPGAIVGGTIYAFSAYHFAQLLGHTNLLASEWLPGYICLLAVGTTNRGRSRAFALVGAAGALLMLALCDWQYVLFAGIFTLCYAVYQTIARRTIAPLVVAGGVGLLWLTAVAPLLLATWREIPSIANVGAPLAGPALFSADLLSFVVPPPLQSWWGVAAERIGGRAIAPAVERSVYVGLIPFALACYGLWRRPRAGLFWVLSGGLFAVFAMGPTLRLAGQEVIGPNGHPIELPYRWLMTVPVVNVSRVPSRFAVLVTLSLAVLSGYGVAALARHGARLFPRTLRLLLAALIALILAEQWSVPYPVHALDPPAAYQQLAMLNDGRAVLELPLNLTRSRSLYYQTVHEHPIVGGYLSRPLPYPLLDLPPFSPDSKARQPDITAPTPPGTGSWALAVANVGWIAVLLEDRKINRAEVDATLGRYARAEPWFADTRVALYETLPPGPPLFYALPVAGWYERELLADGQTRMRWFAREATLSAWSLSTAAQSGALCFDAWSYDQPRRLAVSVDGHPAGEWLVSAPARVRIPVRLAPGHHTIALRSLDSPARPSATGRGKDTRLLALGVSAVELQTDCR